MYFWHAGKKLLSDAKAFAHIKAHLLETENESFFKNTQCCILTGALSANIFECTTNTRRHGVIVENMYLNCMVF